jgi:hypothetical protein
MEIAGSVGAILALKGSAVWSIAPNSMVFDAIQLILTKMSARSRWIGADGDDRGPREIY